MSAPHPRRLQQGEREQVGRSGHERTGVVRGGGHVAPVDDLAVRGRVLDDDAEHLAATGELFEVLRGRDLAQVGDDDVDADSVGSGLGHRDGLRQHLCVDEQNGVVLGAGGSVHQRHRLGDGRALVQQAGGRRGQARQVGHDGLEVEQRLQPSLGDLGLVGRVRGVPGRVLQDVAADDARRVRAVVTQTDHRGEHAVAARLLAEFGDDRRLAGGGLDRQRVRGADRLRDRLVDQSLHVGVPDGLQHLFQLLLRGTDVATDEIRRRTRHAVRHALPSGRGTGSPPHLSALAFRFASSGRSGGLRGSGENCTFGATTTAAGTLPPGVVSWATK